MSRFSAVPLIVALLTVSCSKEHTDTSFLPDSLFTDYYAHHLILKEEGRILGIDSTHMNARNDSLRTAYRMTKRYIDSTVTAYQSDLRKWRQFYDTVIKRLEEIQRDESNRANPRKL